MKVVISGGCGFLGQRVASAIIDNGSLCGENVHKIILVDKFKAPLASKLQNDDRVVVQEKVGACVLFSFTFALPLPCIRGSVRPRLALNPPLSATAHGRIAKRAWSIGDDVAGVSHCLVACQIAANGGIARQRALICWHSRHAYWLMRKHCCCHRKSTPSCVDTPGPTGIVLAVRGEENYLQWTRGLSSDPSDCVPVTVEHTYCTHVR